jgi:hypothetical protein
MITVRTFWKAPFSIFKKKEAKPNAEMAKEEVTRRYNSTHPQLGRNGPRPKKLDYESALQKVER